MRNISHIFPLQLLINLASRQDRREEVMPGLLTAGFTPERFPGLDASRSKIRAHAGPLPFRGYESTGRYALALTKRLAVREAKIRKCEAVLLFEDDVVIHPNFESLFAQIEIPDDWGLLYLGCTHIRKPEWVSPRLVRANYAVDNHAVAIHSRCYNEAMNILNRHGKEGILPGASDQYLAILQKSVPSYACYPNLAWQKTSNSDLLKKRYSNYSTDGQQRTYCATVAQLLPDLMEEFTNNGGEPMGPVAPQRFEQRVNLKPRIGLLFLTRGEVNHPDVWREYVAEAPDQVRIFSHPKNPEKLIAGTFLENTRINAYFETNWGGIGLVSASRALLLEALKDESLSHFVLLSESCVPIKPLPELLRRLELDPRPQFQFKCYSDASPIHTVRIAKAPLVPLNCWRFTPQWWLLDRVASFIATGVDYTGLFEQMNVSDESYFATVLTMQGYPLDGNVVCRQSTWTSWEPDAGSPQSWLELPQEKLCEILASNAFFARKFPQGADIGRFQLHRSPRNTRSAENFQSAAVS